MREPSPARRWVARTVAAAAGLARPPAELSARVRWLLLALGLPTMALLAFVTVVRSPATWPLLPALGLGGTAAAAALRPRAGGAVLLAAVLAQVPSLTVIATLAYLLGDVLRRQQRVTAREQVLSRVALQGLRAQVALALDRVALTAKLAARHRRPAHRAGQPGAVPGAAGPGGRRTSVSTCRCASCSSPTWSRTWPAPSTPPGWPPPTWSWS
ncbi:MAG TPA: hypothetical protein VFL71_12430 [Actinomycetes bacterium]|nr:hypothetical protein [Actinomycetes bacterium]